MLGGTKRPLAGAGLVTGGSGAGAIEAAATVLGLHQGMLPPNANFSEPYTHCNINVISNEAVAAEPEAAISNSFAFGGLNAVVAFKRWD